MKPIELPCNFKYDLLDEYKRLEREYNIEIDSIFLPPYMDDYECTRRTIFLDNNKPIMTREEYSEYLHKVDEMFKDKIMLLVQNPEFGLSENVLRYYHDTFNITKYCVSNLKFAKLIKKLYPDSKVVCSIVRRAEEKEFDDPEYTSTFDEFVLWFPFLGGNVDRVKKLPKNNYVLLVNSECHMDCDGIHHWYPELCTKEQRKVDWGCTLKRPREVGKSTRISYLQYLEYEPYISSVKFQGREYPTDKVIDVITQYLEKDKKYSNSLQYSNFLI